MTAPAEVALKKQSAKTALVEITIHEGRKRQVRRMFAAVGLPVEELHRRRYGPITDKGMEPGAHRELTERRGRGAAPCRRGGGPGGRRRSRGPAVLLPRRGGRVPWTRTRSGAGRCATVADQLDVADPNPKTRRPRRDSPEDGAHG